MTAFVPQLLPYVLLPIDSIVDAKKKKKNTDKRSQALPILMAATPSKHVELVIPSKGSLDKSPNHFR